MATKKAKKVSKVMREYKRGTLKSSSGKKVKSRKQAVAIAISEGRRAAGEKPWPPKSFYDNPYPKRQPRDKDDVLVKRNVRGRRTVLRKDKQGSKKKVHPEPKYEKIPNARKRWTLPPRGTYY